MAADWIPALTAKVLAALDRRRLPGTIAMAAAVVAGIIFISASVFGDPTDGEPSQVIRIARPVATGLGGPIASVPPPTEMPEAAVVPVPTSAGSTGDPALLEVSKVGLLPRIAADGRKPMHVYARASDPASDRRPKVAIVVGGLGVGKAILDAALARLPADVSLAFTSYGPELGEDVAAVRAKGHEVLLEVPLEPEDYPTTDPGVHTLTTDASFNKNTKRLAWHLSRFTGYAGLISTHGSKFLADRNDVTFLVRRARDRGLFFVDAGPLPGTTTRDVAAIWGASFARIDGTIDRSLSRDAIDKELAALEASAKKRGFAIGVMTALPITVDRLATWVGELEAKGIELVPVSSLVTGGGQALAALPVVSAPAVSTATPKARATSKPKLQNKTTTAARGTRSKVKPKPVAAKPNPRTRPTSTTLKPAPAEPPATPTSAPHP